MANAPTYYWDSCVFLHSVSPDPAFPDRKKAVEHWLDRAEAGDIRLFAIERGGGLANLTS